MPSVITIKDLATVLEVSPSTISKALSDSSEISSNTKKRVRETAKSLGYIPNHYARSLKSKITKTIGVIVPNVLDDFFAKVLHGIEKEASKCGFTVLVTFSNDKKKSELKNLRSLLNHSVDGILISFSKETQKSSDYDNIRQIMTYGIPIVMFDRVDKGLPLDSVTVDDFAGAHRATRYLLDSGCQRIAFLSPISNTSVGKSRKLGYVSAIKDYVGESSPPFYIEFGDYKKFRMLLENTLRDYPLDGILAADELSAIYTLGILQQMGYQVPKDISVIGFTDGPMAESANPPLSVVSQHAEIIGQISFRLIRERLVNTERKNKNVVVQTDLILRGSTRGRPINDNDR